MNSPRIRLEVVKPAIGLSGLPAIIAAAGDRAAFRFGKFVTANIKNPNTRTSYARVVREFCTWCEEPGFELGTRNSIVISAHVELLGRSVTA